jgi:hypothetical protein
LSPGDEDLHDVGGWHRREPPDLPPHEMRVWLHRHRAHINSHVARDIPDPAREYEHR